MRLVPIHARPTASSRQTPSCKSSNRLSPGASASVPSIWTMTASGKRSSPPSAACWPGTCITHALRWTWRWPSTPTALPAVRQRSVNQYVPIDDARSEDDKSERACPKFNNISLETAASASNCGIDEVVQRKFIGRWNHEAHFDGHRSVSCRGEPEARGAREEETSPAADADRCEAGIRRARAASARFLESRIGQADAARPVHPRRRLAQRRQERT